MKAGNQYAGNVADSDPGALPDAHPGAWALRKCRSFLRSSNLYRRVRAQIRYLHRRFRKPRPFAVTKDDIAPVPDKVGISTSVLCNARCRFCPPNRGRLIPQKNMTLELAEKIFCDLREMRFKGWITLTENGEFLLCPDVFRILRALRRHLPENRLVIFTNMGLMDAAAAEQVLLAHPQEIHFNVDGASAKTYNAMKPGLRYEVVMANIRGFLSRREKTGAATRIVVHVANLRRYVRDVERKQIDLPDDTAIVARRMRWLLRPTDEINTHEAGFAMWALRDKLRIPKRDWCEYAMSGRDYCYVAPGGRLYLCCLDDNARLAYGSLATEHLWDSWRNERHVELWNLIAQQRFKEVGEPCSICLSHRSRPRW